MPSRAPSARRGATRRRGRLRWLLLPLLALAALGVLVVLALPFRDAPDQAEAARAELVAAGDALADDDVDKASAAVARAREHADALQGSVQGLGGDVWSRAPVVGGAVGDVRHLGNALDELVTVAETGVQVVPQVRGEDATLMRGGNVDLDTLAEVTERLAAVSASLARARSELGGVADERPVAGTRLADARDTALGEVEPLEKGLAVVEPLLDDLPRMLGAEEDRQYLVALLNPAEMLNSGGTPLSFVTMGFDKGRLTLEDPVDGTEAPGIARPRYWKKVKGNPFHRGRTKVALATMAPDWSVSGNELANAWRSLRGRRMSGVVAVDVVALADLLGVTGPIEHPRLGTLTADNLTQRLVGSYDAFPDNDDRKAINRSLAPVFSNRMLSGDPIEVGRSLGRSAQERRFAVYLRNPEEQAAFDEFGLTGRLAPLDRDYVGVFTQNRVASKSDYWQRRAVRSDVTLREDGSAHVRLSVTIHNDSPPYLQPEPDPRSGYFTRWNNLRVMTMVPEGARFTAGTVDGRPFPIQRGRFFGRTFQRQTIEFAPQARHVLVVEYDVPSVAAPGPGGSLRYGLALDPQGMVDPQAVTVRVRFPRGYVLDEVPAGWRRAGARVASYGTDGLEATETHEVVATPAR